MEFKWKQVFFALAVAGAMMALFAAVICGIENNFVGAIISGVVMCGWVFVAAGMSE